MRRIRKRESDFVWNKYWIEIRKYLLKIENVDQRNKLRWSLIPHTRSLVRRAYQAGYKRGLEEKDNGELATLKKNIRKLL